MLPHQRSWRLASTPSRARNAGFTLTEISIVLGIVGLVLGAIWVSASTVYNNLRLNQALRDNIAMVNSVRAMYGTTQGFDAGDLTTSMMAAGIFPPDMIVDGVPTNAWNTTDPAAGIPGSGISIGSQIGWGGCPTSPNTLEIVYWGLSNQEAIELLAHYIGNGSAQISCVYGDHCSASGTFLSPSTTTLDMLTDCFDNVVISFSQ